MLTLPPLTSEFVGMVGYAPASFHDLMDDEVESDGSSISDVMAPGHPLSRKCAMANILIQLPGVVESLQTHTPPDPVRRPWRVHRSTARSYDKGDRASRHLCWRTRRSILRHVRGTR